MFRNIFLLFLSTATILSACGTMAIHIDYGNRTVTPSSQPDAVHTAAPADPPIFTSVLGNESLTLLALQNAKYHSSLWGDFQLTDGIYYRTPSYPGESPQIYSTQLFGLIAYGDLNADGAGDAIVILQTYNGGNKDTKELAAVLNQNGEPYNISTVEVSPGMAVENIQIQSGVITLDGRVLGPNDPLCCPSQFTTRQFRLQGGQLISLSVPGPTSAPTAGSTYEDPVGATRIQFAPNGTWAEVTGKGNANQATDFVLGALKDQVMSVSVQQGGGYPIMIKGQDGIILTPVKNGYSFWRGALPATQDYIITVNTPVAGDFTLRVAVNPPGMDKQFFQHRNESTGVLLTYNDAFAPTNGLLDSYISTGNYKIQPDLILRLIDTKAFENTNLSAVYMTIGSTRDAQSVKSCRDIDWNGLPEQVVGTETINGYEFFHTRRAGVAAGHVGEQEIYRMVYGNICYEIINHIHSTDIGQYALGTVVEFDRSAIIQKLNDNFSSFRIN